MVIDPRPGGVHGPVIIHGHVIKQMSSFKYLGVHLDSDLSWNTQVCSRTQQCLHFLHRLRLFGVCQDIMLIFYKSSN